MKKQMQRFLCGLLAMALIGTSIPAASLQALAAPTTSVTEGAQKAPEGTKPPLDGTLL